MSGASIQTSGVSLNPQSHDFICGHLRPLRANIVVRPLPVPLSKIIHAEWKGGTIRGEVIACGPGEYEKIYSADRSSYRYSKVFTPNACKVGDIVALEGHYYPKVILNGVDHVMCNAKDVCWIDA